MTEQEKMIQLLQGKFERMIQDGDIFGYDYEIVNSWYNSDGVFFVLVRWINLFNDKEEETIHMIDINGKYSTGFTY